jgi:carboxypeptidase PM20D1
LEASEWLLSTGYQPANTIYMAFGHDEEISGFQGAHYMAKYFEDNKIKLNFLFDEGMTLLRDSPFPVDKPMGIVGLSEKGYVTAQLTVNDDGGHSSLSVKETAINVLARALTKVYDNPMPHQFQPINPFYTVSW